MFEATSGVRQGGCTSCPLFTFFIDCTIEALSTSGADGWLGDIHTLLLMDDTVLFDTNRARVLDGITIKPTDIYIYLGMPVSNQPLAKQVDIHLRSKMCHLLKFSSFLTKNSDAPYIVKRSVLY